MSPVAHGVEGELHFDNAVTNLNLDASEYGCAVGFVAVA
jgi:hypothetical protein